jgi:hypothetical protein
MDSFTHDAYKEAYTEDEDFKEVFQWLWGQICIEEGDNKAYYHIQSGFPYKIVKLCIPKGERFHLIREAHTSKVAWNFDVGNKVTNLQSNVYLHGTQEDVAWYIIGCMHDLMYHQSQQYKVRFIPSLNCTHSTLGKNFHGFCGRDKNNPEGTWLFIFGSW